MEKAVIIDAYFKGLLSKEECTKILGIDPNVLLEDERQWGQA
ncbi:hypothetical protein [Vulcanibacillus modesticaldus]|nr:hypothetical protein [Vulcanibacillus modesticaldus]